MAEQCYHAITTDLDLVLAPNCRKLNSCDTRTAVYASLHSNLASIPSTSIGYACSTFTLAPAERFSAESFFSNLASIPSTSIG